ncbi:alanine dehydrogenase, partial [Alicyclobacillus acidiphilus]
PRERKQNENRVAITPAGVQMLTAAGHVVYVEAGAGFGAGFSDESYRQAGAAITSGDEVWSMAQMVMKVKEPLSEEYRYFREDLILFTYLHLAAEPLLLDRLIHSGMVSVGYETVQTLSGALPLLMPMSEIAGRMAPQIAAQILENHYGGAGILMGGVPGAVSRTATLALTNATLPYALQIANLGIEAALAENPTLARGLNTAYGKVTCPGVAESLGIELADASELLVS